MKRRTFIGRMAVGCLAGPAVLDALMPAPDTQYDYFDLQAAINRDFNARMRELEEKYYITGDGVTV